MHIFLLTVPFVIILLLSILRISFRKEYRQNKFCRLFAILLFISAYNLFIIYGHQSLFLKQFTRNLTYTDAMLFFLSTPVFYVFLLNLLEERPFLSPLNAKHLWTMIPGFIYFIDYSTLPDEIQEQIVISKQCGILPDEVLYIIGAVSIFFYLFISLKKLQNYLNRHSKELTPGSLRQLYLYSWILYVFAGLCFCFGVLTFLTPSAIKIHYILSSLLILLSICELFIVFYIRPAPLRFVSLQNNDPELEKIQQKGKNDQMLLLAQKIDQIVINEKLYLDHRLDLSSLSEKTGINSHRITACIHAQFSVSVPEYINMYRIEHAKNLLKEGLQTTKIDVLAYDCGYLSRSNFYSTFKRITGMTPSEYKKNVSLN